MVARGISFRVEMDGGLRVAQDGGGVLDALGNAGGDPESKSRPFYEFGFLDSSHSAERKNPFASGSKHKTSAIVVGRTINISTA